MSKDYLLDERMLKKRATGFGLCQVSDDITIEGYPVGIMYREAPAQEGDSGWRFFSGGEDDKTLNNPKLHSTLDVNVVANYDPSIVALLDSPVGSAFERQPEQDDFVPIADWSAQ